jgi:hypothetical protein
MQNIEVISGNLKYWGSILFETIIILYNYEFLSPTIHVDNRQYNFL